MEAFFRSSYNKKELPHLSGSSSEHILRVMGRRLCVENYGHRAYSPDIILKKSVNHLKSLVTSLPALS